MAKLIYGPVLAECIGAEPCSRWKALNWENWRLDFVGRTGTLEIHASQREFPGRRFLCFYKDDPSELNQTVNLDDLGKSGDDWWLKTYYGEWYDAGEDEIILFQTRDTRYMFRVKGEDT